MSDYNTIDDAADTLRFARRDVDATSIYDIRPAAPRRDRRAAARRRQIRQTRQEVEGLRAAKDAGWDVGPELAHEERRLAALEAANRR